MIKDTILNATIKLIDQEGGDVSVRQIAKEADVNVAAINYHFGSKDNLINEVIIIKLERFKVAFDSLENFEVEPIERLQNFLDMLIDLIQANPEVADHIIAQHDLFKTRYEYQDYLQAVGYNKLINVIAEITEISDNQLIVIMCEQVLAVSVMSLITELRISNQNSKFINEIDHKYRAHLFIENYFYKYSKKGK